MLQSLNSEENLLIPDKRSLGLLLLRHRVEDGAQPLVIEPFSNQEDNGKENSQDEGGFGLSPRSSPESLLDLRRCNLANLTSQFTQETDRHVATYGTMEFLMEDLVADTDKTPSLENSFVTKKVYCNLSAQYLLLSVVRG